MPPIQQQQTSRAGLITSLVISIMFALGFLIWAVMNNSELTKQRDATKVLANKYREVVDENVAAVEADAYRSLKSGAGANISSPTVFDYLNRQRQRLLQLITGGSASEQGPAVNNAKGAVETAEKDIDAAWTEIKNNPALADAKVPTDSLTKAIVVLSSRIRTDSETVAAAKKSVTEAADAVKAENARAQAEIDKHAAAVKVAQAAVTTANTGAQTAVAEKQKQVDDFSKQIDEAKKTLNEAQQASQTAIQNLEGDVKKAKDEIQKLQSLLARYRPNVKEATVRQIDATITQLGDNNTCYIDLGYGDHVMPGLTFEVYSKLDGVPPLAAGTSNFDLPKGKASVEIIEVGQNSSRCRVLLTRPGNQLSQGDLCANLVYDKNIKPVFFVFGSFDMDMNGVATPQEAEIIKNLIVRWGGKVADKIGPEVDYVVVGKEPVVPAYTPDELQNPIIKQRSDQAKADLAAFNDVVNKAGEIHIPVLNQNRFLYYTGYFDAAKK